MSSSEIPTQPNGVHPFKAEQRLIPINLYKESFKTRPHLETGTPKSIQRAILIATPLAIAFCAGSLYFVSQYINKIP